MRHGMAWHGTAMAMACHAMAWHGMAWLGMAWPCGTHIGPLWDNCGRYVVADGAAGARSVGLGAFKSLAEVPLAQTATLRSRWRRRVRNGAVAVWSSWSSAARVHGLLYLEAAAGNGGCAAAGDRW